VPVVAAPVVAMSGSMPDPLSRLRGFEQPKPSHKAALPEILPPPPPPPPVVVQPEGPVPVAPTMEEVQERLREDATVRLQQLDIENIWRQVLAHPTLEERAEYLREAAIIMAEEQGIDVTQVALAPEYDLSLIEAQVMDGTVSVPDAEDVGAMVRSLSDDQTEDQVETAELARSLLDMMSSSTNTGLPHERALAADTLLRLLPRLSVKSLTMLAQRLSIMETPPHLLVAKLIRDERVEVSGPLLEDCMQIADNDLIAAIEEANTGKQRMIARRRRLPRVISDRLIATHDPSVLLTLVRNAHAEISHDGFIELTKAAGEMPDLMAPLSTRADLAAPNAFELFWPAPPQLRRFLLHRFLTDSETLTKILKITLSTKDGEDTRDADLPSAGETTEILNAACQGRIESSAQKLSVALNVDPGTVERIFLDKEGDAMIVLLKAAGYPRSSVGDLLHGLKRGATPLITPERDVDELASMFDTLSINKARILLTYWDWAVRKSGPYAPLN
jgi:uncharacterized protein (DUF2336 family)